MTARRKTKRAYVVVTAGPTRERIDPVRFISNYSTGMLGYEIAKEASRRGFRVTLISGPTALEDPPGIKTIRVESAADMKAAVGRATNGADCLIMAAAVSDWRPAKFSKRKLKRGSGSARLDLVENPDILAEIGRNRNRSMRLVGFALETEAVEENAIEKMKRKGLDMVVANAISGKSTPFGDNYINISVLESTGGKIRAMGITKRQAAKIILDKAFGFNI